MKILLIDNGTTLLEKLQKLIPGIEVTKKINDINLDNDLNYDLLVLSGSSHYCVTYDKRIFSKEIELLKNFPKAVIGICVGAELLADMFGAKLIQLEEPIKGKRIINFNTPNIFDKNKIEVFENHNWAIIEPSGDIEIIAQSENGIEIFKSKNRPIYGLQFHPENLVDETEGDEIFLNLLNNIQTI